MPYQNEIMFFLYIPNNFLSTTVNNNSDNRKSVKIVWVSNVMQPYGDKWKRFFTDWYIHTLNQTNSNLCPSFPSFSLFALSHFGAVCRTHPDLWLLPLNNIYLMHHCYLWLPQQSGQNRIHQTAHILHIWWNFPSSSIHCFLTDKHINFLIT